MTLLSIILVAAAVGIAVFMISKKKKGSGGMPPSSPNPPSPPSTPEPPSRPTPPPVPGM